jgi:hypothetical protein
MPALSQLSRVRPMNADVDLGEGDVVHIVFDSNKITPAWMQESQVRAGANDALAIPKSLAGVLISWDVTEDDERTPLLPTEANIALFSYPAQREILKRVMDAAMPSDAEGEGSSSPSKEPSTASTGEQPMHQNGAATSPSPEHSASLSKT